MKTFRLLAVWLFAAAFGGTNLLAAPANPTFTFQENGQGKLELPNGFVIPLPGALASDPGPGGLSSALTFTTHPQEQNFVVGDVLIFDNGKISDVLRFNPDPGPGPGLTSPVLFYSNDLAGGLLADTGLPSAFYVNSVTVSENHSGLTIYTPIAGQPGFEPAVGTLPVTYQIFSTPDASSTLSLFALAICGIALARGKLCKAS